MLLFMFCTLYMDMYKNKMANKDFENLKVKIIFVVVTCLLCGYLRLGRFLYGCDIVLVAFVFDFEWRYSSMWLHDGWCHYLVVVMWFCTLSE